MALTFTIFGGGGRVAKEFTKVAVNAGHQVHSALKDEKVKMNAVKNYMFHIQALLHLIV